MSNRKDNKTTDKSNLVIPKHFIPKLEMNSFTPLDI